MRDTTILVLAKAPVPGLVKTRLCPPLRPGQAAALAAAAIEDTLAAVLATPAVRRVLVLDGEPGRWLPAGIEVRPQAGGGLDERIGAALATADGPVLLVGMDTPQLTLRHLAVSWSGYDAWFGPAADGGFWALGLREPDPDLVRGVPMSSSATGICQLARLSGAGLRVGCLPVLQDVDTIEDAAAVAVTAPKTRFAERFTALMGDPPIDNLCPGAPRELPSDHRAC